MFDKLKKAIEDAKKKGLLGTKAQVSSTNKRDKDKKGSKG